jgi:hypothetical protein
MGQWRYSSTILDLGTSCRWVVNFTSQPFTPGEGVPNTYWIGRWVGPRAGLDDVKRRKIILLPGLELRQARSQSLYRLPSSNIMAAKYTFRWPCNAGRRSPAIFSHSSPRRLLFPNFKPNSQSGTQYSWSSPRCGFHISVMKNAGQRL